MKNLFKSSLIFLSLYVTNAFAGFPLSVTLYNYNHGINSAQSIVFSLPNGITKTVYAGYDLELTPAERALLSDVSEQLITFTIKTADGRAFSRTGTSKILFKGHVHIDATMYSNGPGHFEYGYCWRWVP